MENKFIHLHSHSEYSVADGMFSPKVWAKAYKEKGFIGAALTDHGSMGGVLEFYHAMHKEGLTPILGMEAYFNRTPEIKDPENRKSMHLVLLAKNKIGLKNLYILSKLSYTDGYYYRPRVGNAWLKQYSEGLVCLSACQGGPLSIAIYEDEDAGDNGLYPRLHDTYKEFKDIFGNDFYVELQGHDGNQERVNRALHSELIVGEKAKFIITNDNHYIEPEDAKIQVVLKSSAYGNSEAAKSYTECDSLWLKNDEQIKETFKVNHPYLPEEIIRKGMEATQEVFAKCCHLELAENERHLPKFRPKVDSKELFKRLGLRELKKYIENFDKETKQIYIERFKTEFAVIAKYDLEDYFLIVWDLCRYANKRNIYVGLGRGSAAGCLISFLMGIVRIDPIKFDLYFERFLNAVRCETGEMPDIDLDFESVGRDEIKRYIEETYGSENVCEMGTYGRMQLKTALMDFGKSMGVANHAQILAITTKLTEDDFEKAYDESLPLQKLCDGNHEFVEAVERILGQIKSQGVHPAGVIISPEPIENLTPLKTINNAKRKMRIVTTASEDKQVIAQGLMKVDVLGVKQYDIVKYVIENSECPLTRDDYVEKMDYSDAKVWEAFQKGYSDAVFQFASSGMKELLVNIVPTRIDDLIAANALYRPGCLRNGWHNDYCDRKHGRVKTWDKMHPIVESITKDTYGILVYQEQVMAIINQLGGIPLIESDIIRSALGKKDEAKLKKFGPMFIDGASKHIPKEKAESLWRQIMFSSEYNFNKSHSAAYSVLAYVSQHMKVYYPNHYWAVVCEWDIIKGKSDEMLQHIAVSKEMDVEWSLPTINKSKPSFFYDGAKVIMPFTVIKGLGDKVAVEIESKAPFVDFEDFHKRINKATCKVNVIMSMIYAGVFDSFADRADLMQYIYSTRTKKQLDKLKDISEINWNVEYYAALGFFETKIKSMKEYEFSPYVITERELHDCMEGDGVVVAGMIDEVSSIKTRSGDHMGFVSLIDNDEKIELTVFSDVWGSFRSDFRKGNIIQIEGTKSAYGGANNKVEVLSSELIGVI
jgi:DNA polymerase-3 subunit alpha